MEIIVGSILYPVERVPGLICALRSRGGVHVIENGNEVTLTLFDESNVCLKSITIENGFGQYAKVTISVYSLSEKDIDLIDVYREVNLSFAN